MYLLVCVGECHFNGLLPSVHGNWRMLFSVYVSLEITEINFSLSGHRICRYVTPIVIEIVQYIGIATIAIHICHLNNSIKSHNIHRHIVVLSQCSSGSFA